MKTNDYSKNKLDKRIKTLTDKGVNVADAISKVASVDNKNPYKVANETDYDTTDEYNDFTYSEGSIVSLKNDMSKEYEVINIRNRESIVLRDLSDNSEVKAADEDIIPLVENKMTKLNEAQYNLSIDGLETTDAETLSQMLSLAGQADQNAEEPAVDQPEIDMAAVVSTEDQMPEETLDTTVVDASVPAEDEEGINMDYGMEEYEQTGVEEEAEPVTEDYLEEPAQKPLPAEKSKMEEDNIPGNELDGIEEDSIVAEPELTDDEINDAISETLKAAGVQLDEVSEEEATDGKEDLPVDPVGDANPDEHFEEHPVEDGERGLEATKGFEKNPVIEMKIGKMVNQDKIQSICETAERMYAKKEPKEWLALDRRYIEKLIIEGVSYSNASKMLLKAKAGK